MSRRTSLIGLILLYAGLAVISFLLYFQGNARFYNLPRNRIFNADTDSVSAATFHGAVDGDGSFAPCHPLVAALFKSNAMLSGWLGFPAATGAVSLYAAAASLTLLIAFALFRRILNGDNPAALLFTAAYAAGFSNAVFFNIPETYVFADLAIACCLYYLAAVRPRTRGQIAGLALLIGCASLVNPPLLLLSVPAAFLSWKEGARGEIVCYGLAFPLFAAANIAIFSFGWLAFARDFMGYWADPRNLLRVAYYARVAVSFLFYAVIDPAGIQARSPGLEALRGYFTAPAPVAGFVLYAGALAAAVARLVRRRNVFGEACGALVLALVIFYVYVNPEGAMLYSSQALLPLAALLASAFNEFPGRFRYVLPAALAGALALHNLSAVAGYMVP